MTRNGKQGQAMIGNAKAWSDKKRAGQKWTVKSREEQRRAWKGS